MLTISEMMMRTIEKIPPPPTPATARPYVTRVTVVFKSKKLRLENERIRSVSNPDKQKNLKKRVHTTMRVIMFGAAPQIAEPISKTTKANTNVHLRP
jgi:hypothetical protein